MEAASRRRIIKSISVAGAVVDETAVPRTRDGGDPRRRRSRGLGVALVGDRSQSLRAAVLEADALPTPVRTPAEDAFHRVDLHAIDATLIPSSRRLI